MVSGTKTLVVAADHLGKVLYVVRWASMDHVIEPRVPKTNGLFFIGPNDLDVLKIF